MIRLTRRQIREIDRLAIERYHIPGVVLMENAARAVAATAAQMLAGHPAGPIVILCGGGNNGGDGLAAARHLHNLGHDLSILLTADPGKYAGEAKANWDIVQAMALPAASIDIAALERSRPRLIIDAIFGTGLSQRPRDPFPKIVAAIAALGVPVLSVDLPSGLDCDTGRPLGSCVTAAQTVTFVAEKIGFAHPQARPFLGNVTIADIGCPIELIQQVTGQMP